MRKGSLLVWLSHHPPTRGGQRRRHRSKAHVFFLAPHLGRTVAREEGRERVILEKPGPLGILFARVAAQRLQPPVAPRTMTLSATMSSPLLHSKGPVTGSFASKDGNSFNKYLSSTFMY